MWEVHMLINMPAKKNLLVFLRYSLIIVVHIAFFIILFLQL